MIDIENFLRGGSSKDSDSSSEINLRKESFYRKPEPSTPASVRTQPTLDATSARPKPNCPTGLHVEILMTSYTRRNLNSVVGRVFPVLEVRGQGKGQKFVIELHPGNQIWLPLEAVRPFILNTQPTVGWADATTWR